MLPTGMRVLVCTEPQDMRRSFDKLAQVARELLGEEPQSGALYVFVSRSATRVKVLWWDRNGYCMGVVLILITRREPPSAAGAA